MQSKLSFPVNMMKTISKSGVEMIHSNTISMQALGRMLLSQHIWDTEQKTYNTNRSSCLKRSSLMKGDLTIISQVFKDYGYVIYGFGRHTHYRLAE